MQSAPLQIDLEFHSHQAEDVHYERGLAIYSLDLSSIIYANDIFYRLLDIRSPTNAPIQLSELSSSKMLPSLEQNPVTWSRPHATMSEIMLRLHRIPQGDKHELWILHQVGQLAKRGPRTLAFIDETANRIREERLGYKARSTRMRGRHPWQQRVITMRKFVTGESRPVELLELEPAPSPYRYPLVASPLQQ